MGDLRGWVQELRVPVSPQEVEARHQASLQKSLRGSFAAGISSISVLGGGCKGFLGRESYESSSLFLSLSNPHSSPLKAMLPMLLYSGVMERKKQRESSLQLQLGMPLRVFTPRNSAA